MTDLIADTETNVPKPSKGKRLNHNELERKRRHHQKEKLNELRDIIPTLQLEKPSTVLIMQKAKEYIELLKKRLEEVEAENVNLRNTVMSMTQGHSGQRHPGMHPVAPIPPGASATMSPAPHTPTLMHQAHTHYATTVVAAAAASTPPAGTAHHMAPRPAMYPAQAQIHPYGMGQYMQARPPMLQQLGTTPTMTSDAVASSNAAANLMMTNMSTAATTAPIQILERRPSLPTPGAHLTPPASSSMSLTGETNDISASTLPNTPVSALQPTPPPMSQSTPVPSVSTNFTSAPMYPTTPIISDPPSTDAAVPPTSLGQDVTHTATTTTTTTTTATTTVESNNLTDMDAVLQQNRELQNKLAELQQQMKEMSEAQAREREARARTYDMSQSIVNTSGPMAFDASSMLRKRKSIVDFEYEDMKRSYFNRRNSALMTLNAIQEHQPVTTHKSDMGSYPSMNMGKRNSLPSSVLPVLPPLGFESLHQLDDVKEEEVSCLVCNRGQLGSVMLDCDRCHNWFHAHCVDIDAQAIPDSWLCSSCAGTGTLPTSS